MKLLMLSASKGSMLEVNITGKDQEDAMDSIEELFIISEEGKNIHVDLINQVILDSAESEIVKFDIDNFRKTCVLEGLDEIGISLKHSELNKSFEKNKKEVTPWIFK